MQLGTSWCQSGKLELIWKYPFRQHLRRFLPPPYPPALPWTKSNPSSFLVFHSRPASYSFVILHIDAGAAVHSRPPVLAATLGYVACRRTIPSQMIRNALWHCACLTSGAGTLTG